MQQILWFGQNEQHEIKDKYNVNQKRNILTFNISSLEMKIDVNMKRK